MAIYHLNAQIIQRSKGQSIVEVAARRSGMKLLNRYLGQYHDYQKKSTVVYSRILLPETVSMKFADLAALWNAVEERENRKDAQLARQIGLALPK